MVCRRYKGERQPPCLASHGNHAVKTKRLTFLNRAVARRRLWRQPLTRWRCYHVVARQLVQSLGQIVQTEEMRVDPRAWRVRAYARWITYARSLVHDALAATRPTVPRTVIGAGESESVPAAADSVVHKRGGRRHLFPSRARRSPSLPIRSPLSRSCSPSLSRSYGQPIAAGKLKRARSRPIASDVPACYPVRVYIKAAGLSAIRPHTLDHVARSPFGRLRPSSASFFSWPYFSRARAPPLSSFRTRERRDPRIQPFAIRSAFLVHDAVINEI